MLYFSKKIVKINSPFFRENFYKNFWNFSETTQYFFLIIFVPLSEVLSHFLENSKINYIGKLSNKKISHFFFRVKNELFGNFSKIRNICSCLFLFPLDWNKTHFFTQKSIIDKKWKFDGKILGDQSLRGLSKLFRVFLTRWQLRAVYGL